ncbi:MAG: 30S ribosomal protein S15 [Candidatus Enterosoma sp.]|nr:30S ribosomal protein S15 [bacterium]MDY5649668.1 30S ribosomal protein S15 [Candidatus Enterosoma sp.]MDY5866030.1 30S ribosomal protein S15 [Candidatus Enterosoma sp.]
MALSKEEKKTVIEENRLDEKDTGSCEVQIALLTKRITKLTAHMIANKHDYSSKRGMDILIARRKNLLSYLKTTDLQRYLDLTQKLGLKAN